MTARPRAHLLLALAAALGLVALATSTRARRAHPSHTARYLSARGATLRYVRAGHGRTVALLHGFGESLLAWRGVFDQLAASHDVVALDLPGFGLSTKRSSGYAADSLAADVLAALDALGVGNVVLVGHSMGGAVAAAAALAAPSRVSALVLVDPALVGAPFVLPDSAAAATSAARSAITEYEALRTRFTAPHDSQWLTESPEALAYLPAADTAYRVSLGAVLREFAFDSLSTDRARQLTVPTLVLWGEYDQLFSLEQGRRLAARLPGARLEVIGRSWHRPHVERPTETAAAIERFLASLPVPGSRTNP